MAYAYELENHLTKKIRRKCWHKYDYLEFNLDEEDYFVQSWDGCLFREDGHLWTKNDWEYHTEPKPKKEITLYRFTYKESDNVYFQTYWSTESSKPYDTELVKTETKVIEV